MRPLVPRLLDDLIRSIVDSSPTEMQWPVLSALLGLYAWAAIALFSSIWCWLDYQVATARRRSGSAPLSLQYGLGDKVEAARKWVGGLGLVFFLVTAAWAVVAYSTHPQANTPLDWFKVNWEALLNAIWS